MTAPSIECLIFRDALAWEKAHWLRVEMAEKLENRLRDLAGTTKAREFEIDWANAAFDYGLCEIYPLEAADNPRKS